jgi:hypothetical protein
MKYAGGEPKQNGLVASRLLKGREASNVPRPQAGAAHEIISVIIEIYLDVPGYFDKH